MIGIIYYAYGAPKSLDDVLPYFSHIMKGQTPPPHVVDSVTAQFKNLGGVDPLAANTERIAKGLEHALRQRFMQPIKVYNAYKHTEPYIPDVVDTMLKDGITTFITLPVNPIMSSGAAAFHDEVSAILASHNVTVIHAKNWHKNAELLAVYKDRVQRAYEWMPTGKQAQTHVLYTVHSQPIDSEKNENYVNQYFELAEAISKAAEIENWHLTYRSSHGKAGWLGPDVKDMMYTLHGEGAQGFVTCELLSLSADIESYFEIGSECQIICEELQVDFAQAEFPGDSYDTIQALAAIVTEAIPAE